MRLGTPRDIDRGSEPGRKCDGGGNARNGAALVAPARWASPCRSSPAVSAAGHGPTPTRGAGPQPSGAASTRRARRRCPGGPETGGDPYRRRPLPCRRRSVGFEVVHRAQPAHPGRFDFERDTPVGREMAVSCEATPQVRPEVADQESHHPEFAELADVHELVGHQPRRIGGAAPNHDRAAEGDGVGLGRHRTTDDDAIPRSTLHSHRGRLSIPAPERTSWGTQRVGRLGRICGWRDSG